MAKKNVSPFRHKLEYICVRLIIAVIIITPLSIAVCLLRLLAFIFWMIDKRHRLRVEEQIKMALGCDEMTAKRIGKNVYRSLAAMIAELPRLRNLTREKVKKIIDTNNALPKIQKILNEGNGLICATGHISNWELCGMAGVLLGFSKGAIARPLDNPYINHYVREFRESCGQEIWDKKGALVNVVRTLKQKSGFGILTDQDAGKRGIFVDFFGKPASTIPTVAELSIRQNAPIMVIWIKRIKPMQFELIASDVIRPNHEEDQKKETVRILTAVNQCLEKAIREAPEQWLWMHRRWKTQPNE